LQITVINDKNGGLILIRCKFANLLSICAKGVSFQIFCNLDHKIP